MKIAIDVSPLKLSHSSQHSVRGSGFYITYLVESLQKYFPENRYELFTHNPPRDVQIVHYPYFEPFFLTLPFIKRKKSVVTIHDLTPVIFPKEFPSGVKGNIRWQVQKILAKNMDGIITDSLSSQNDLIRYIHVKKEKIFPIYLAPGEQYKQKKSSKDEYKHITQKYNLPEKFLLYVGDVTPNKNLPRIVEAAGQSKIPLVLTGKALSQENIDKKNIWNRDLLKVKSLAKKYDTIYIAGFVSSEDLVSLYNNAQALLMPSLYEGFGLPILEAMACGCPVITSSEGSLPEVAGDAAIYVDPYSIESISDAMKLLYSDNVKRMKYRNLGLENVKRFSWKKTAEETIDVYKKIVNK